MATNKLDLLIAAVVVLQAVTLIALIILAVVTLS
jgi:hypothetical protein